MAPPRDDWNKVWFGVARAVAGRSSCIRDQVGAVIVVDNEFTYIGYNGPASGKLNCDEGGCPRGMLTNEQLPHGSPFNGCVKCHAVHAEINALRKYLKHYRAVTPNVMLYTTRKPCEQCDMDLEYFGFMRDQIVWED